MQLQLLSYSGTFRQGWLIMTSCFTEMTMGLGLIALGCQGCVWTISFSLPRKFQNLDFYSVSSFVKTFFKFLVNRPAQCYTDFFGGRKSREGESGVVPPVPPLPPCYALCTLNYDSLLLCNEHLCNYSPSFHEWCKNSKRCGVVNWGNFGRFSPELILLNPKYCDLNSPKVPQTKLYE